MAVTAKFVVDRIDALPNVAAALTLRLYNDDAAARSVTITTSGDLREHARVERTTATLDTNQIVDVPVTVLLPPTVAAGLHTFAAEVEVAPNAGSAPDAAADDATVPDAEGGPADAPEPATVSATATVQVEAHTEYELTLQPANSRSSSSRKHLVQLNNTGNVAVSTELSVGDVDDAVTVELGQATLTVPPGGVHETSLRITPTTKFWNGPSRHHPFVVEALAADGRSDRMEGTYEQRPRVPAWLGPAAAGAAAALLISAIVWFAFLRPWVEDTADTAAADAIEQDRAALQERIEELEAAAAEAEELPLGTPTDVRLDVDPAGGNTGEATTTVDSGMILSVTDIVLQNPTGAVGTVTWSRGDEVLLRSELANFRDFDLHFVAPYQFDDDAEIRLEVECRTPGAGQSTCPIGASLVGFIDEAN